LTTKSNSYHIEAETLVDVDSGALIKDSIDPAGTRGLGRDGTDRHHMLIRRYVTRVEREVATLGHVRIQLNMQ